MIAWNYSKLAPDYGHGQMKELNALLKEIFRNFDINIHMRKGKLEVKSRVEPKDMIIKIMKKISMIYPVDFVLAFGDEDRYGDILSFLDQRKNYSRLCSSNCSTNTFGIKNTQFLQNVLLRLIDGN